MTDVYSCGDLKTLLHIIMHLYIAPSLVYFHNELHNSHCTTYFPPQKLMRPCKLPADLLMVLTSSFMSTFAHEIFQNYSADHVLHQLECANETDRTLRTRTCARSNGNVWQRKSLLHVCAALVEGSHNARTRRGWDKTIPFPFLREVEFANHELAQSRVWCFVKEVPPRASESGMARPSGLFVRQPDLTNRFSFLGPDLTIASQIFLVGSEHQRPHNCITLRFHRQCMHAEMRNIILPKFVTRVTITVFQMCIHLEKVHGMLNYEGYDTNKELYTLRITPLKTHASFDTTRCRKVRTYRVALMYRSTVAFL